MTSENGFQELGILGRKAQSTTVEFYPNNRSYWTRDVLAYGYASGLIITYSYTDPDTIAFDGFFRDQGLPVRCVMEELSLLYYCIGISNSELEGRYVVAWENQVLRQAGDGFGDAVFVRFHCRHKRRALAQGDWIDKDKCR